MKRLLWFVVIVALGLPTLAGCDMDDTEEVATLAGFDLLARHTPVGSPATDPLFLNLKPGGDVARHWQRLRQRLEQNPLGQEALHDIFDQFKVEILNLEEVIEGPAVSAYWHSVVYVMLEVADEAAARQTMMANLGNASDWEQIEFEGRTIYHGQFREADGHATYLAWTTGSGLLFMTHQNVDSSGYGGVVVGRLQDLLQVTEEESVAALPAWQKLHDRLPESTMGVGFLWLGSENQLPPGDASSLFDALDRSLEGAAVALVPQEDGLRVEIEGIFYPEAGSVPALRAMFDQPAIDGDAWGDLPAGTALALAGHDAATLLPWLQELLGLELDVFQQAAKPLGLDIEEDLLAGGGPLEGTLAVGILPPLAGQPIIEGVTAMQILIALPDAGPAEGEALQRAMESRGAIFGAQEVEGVEVQVQVGTAASGYAVTYGYEDGVLYLGSSSQVVGQGIAARRSDGGLAESAAFRRVGAALPDRPTMAAYVQMAALADLVRANTTEEQYADLPEYRLLELFGAVGLGLRPEPERLSGVLYLWLGE